MTQSTGKKRIALALIALIAIAVIYVLTQSDSASKPTTQTPAATAAAPAKTAPTIDHALLAPTPSDIVLGDPNALITVVEYSSLSCTHCAHFHETVLPDFQKTFIDTGKVKLVLRHFPLNEPAIKAAELVECAGQNGLERANFMKVLFDIQSKWAFDAKFLVNLKQIALVGGIDSAGFDSCMADKSLETRILAMRQQAQEKLAVNSTPTFFINGSLYEGDRDMAGFHTAIDPIVKAGNK